MYKKNIEHIITVSLKYFLNFDYCFFEHTFLVALAGLYFLRIIAAKIGNEFQDSALTVKEDLQTAKSVVVVIIQRWNNSSLHHSLVNSLYGFSEFLPARKPQ